jgi:hypothetical protein
VTVFVDPESTEGVIGSLVGGLIVALALVVGPIAGAQEDVITGTILLTFAAVLAMLSMRGQPSRLNPGDPRRHPSGALQ